METNKKEEISWQGIIVLMLIVFVIFFVIGFVGYNLIYEHGYSEGRVHEFLIGYDIGKADCNYTEEKYVIPMKECFACSGMLYEKVIGEREYENGTIEQIMQLTCDCGKVDNNIR